MMRGARALGQGEHPVRSDFLQSEPPHADEVSALIRRLEGRQQDLNSLHAQRKACESFIKSQPGEGWRPSRPPTMTVDSPAGPWERPVVLRLLSIFGHWVIRSGTMFHLRHILPC